MRQQIPPGWNKDADNDLEGASAAVIDRIPNSYG